MTHLQSLRDIGQSLWLDNITREILDDGTLQRYIDEYDITGLTSNPTIFDQAIGDSSAYDAGIREKAAAGKRDKELFVELALEDLEETAAALVEAAGAIRPSPFPHLPPRGEAP